MDPLPSKPKMRVSDPCNPLYWFPKNIPEYCYYPKPPSPVPAPPSPLIPFPIPLPPQMPFVMPVAYPPMFPPMVPPASMPPLPFGVPIAPSNPMLPVAGIPYPPPALPAPIGPPLPPSLPTHTVQLAGMVPGLPGLVSSDGGINVLPFSDAYSDVLEKQKNKLIRKKMRKVLRDYEYYPYRGSRKLKKYLRKEYLYD